MAGSRKNIKEYLLTKEQVSGGMYAPEEVYYIKDNSKELGPFWQEDLKEFIEDYALFKEGVSVKCLAGGDWTQITTHPLFQRRKPEIIKEFQIDEDDQFYLLKNNKKDGPYSSQEIMAKLDKLEVIYTDFISIDAGQSWGSIHEFEIFDRRTRSNEQLPDSPQGHIFQNSTLDADKAMALSKKNSQDKEFIYDLAYIGNQKLNPNKAQIDDFNPSQKTDSAITVKMTAFAMSFMLIAGVFFTYNKLSGKQDRSVASTKRSKVTKAKPRPTQMAKQETPEDFQGQPKKVSPRPKRTPTPAPRKITRSQEPIKDAEFLNEARFMDDGHIETAELPPEVIFDDNTEALELDPIRQRVSKETFDPQDEQLENYDELDAAREIVDDYLDRSPAAGDLEGRLQQDEFSPEDVVEGDEF